MDITIKVPGNLIDFPGIIPGIKITTPDLIQEEEKEMKVLRCNRHKEEFIIPETSEEYVSGTFHEGVKRIQTHHERYPGCKMKSQ